MSIRKKVFLALAALVVVGLGFVGYIMLTTRSHSPAAEVSYSENGMDLRINYCQPFKKERLIFGNAEQDALLPYGAYWRLGANEATKLTLNSRVNFGGQNLDPGAYALYAFPHEDHWVVGINNKADRWGATPPNFGNDVGRVKAAVIETNESLEQFTISIESRGSQAVVIMQWDQTRVEIPVQSAS